MSTSPRDRDIAMINDGLLHPSRTKGDPSCEDKVICSKINVGNWCRREEWGWRYENDELRRGNATFSTLISFWRLQGNVLQKLQYYIQPMVIPNAFEILISAQ